MAKNKRIYSQYRYKAEMTYLNLDKNVDTSLRVEFIKTIVIDHNYDKNSMPILFVTMKLDKSLVDDMILNINKNLILLAIYKYDNLSDTKEEVEIFRDKFTYFLPDGVNANDPIDYTEENEKEHRGNTFRDIVMGLISINHINRNKKYLELNTVNSTIYDCARYCTSHFDNLVIEPFIFNDTHKRIIMPGQESVRKALEFLNSYRVFYYTPFRFYQDFDYTYVISSSGLAIPKDNELYSSIVVNIRDILESDANDVGLVENKTSGTYEVPVSYVNTSVYDNTIANKSRTKLKGVSSTGSIEKSLNNVADYSEDKISRVRLNNDNDNMIYNLQADTNNKNVLVYFSKADLDSTVFSINKKISVHHIDRYQQYNGNYLLYRKRECYIREDSTFILSTMINLRRVDEPYIDITSTVQ